MKLNLPMAIVALLSWQQIDAGQSPNSERRAAFREAVEQYQVFVVPRCAPQEVETYVTARAERDRSFVQSLRNTSLLADYMSAVADRAKQDANTVFHCFGPPLPHPAPSGSASSQPRPEEKSENTLAEHFAAGDRQFAVMLSLRNAALGFPGM